MNKEQALVSKEFLLEKFPGKGGWTYVEIPEIIPSKNTPFGWVTVKGNIDDYPLKQHKIMPMGNGHLFLSVKASIRKKIKKQAGDSVQVTLYLDSSPIEITEELFLCFENEAKNIYQTFLKIPKGKQKTYIDWIYQAKTEKTKANRIAQMMEELDKIKF